MRHHQPESTHRLEGVSSTSWLVSCLCSTYCLVAPLVRDLPENPEPEFLNTKNTEKTQSQVSNPVEDISSFVFDAK